MKPGNVTCIQRAQFVLPFFEGGEWRDKKASPWDKLLKKHDISTEEVKNLAAYTTERMNRTAALMELLKKIHDDWEISAKSDCIIMETESMKFEDIIPQLFEAGFTENDYILYSDYTRKWGML